MDWFKSRVGDLKKLVAPAASGKSAVPTPRVVTSGKAVNITALKENVNKAIDEWALIRGHSWDIPKEVAGTADTWIEVDLGAHMLVAYSGGRLINGFLVATGASAT